MKYLTIFLSTLGLLSVEKIALAVDCSDLNPQGPDAVISCAASLSGFASAEDFWNNKLFSPVTLDGYCAPNTAPSGLTVAQTALFNLSCANQKRTYFSYAQFIAADAAMKARLGDAYQFMRNSSYAVNTAELSNFLATAAQETTGNGLLPIKYQQDGLYFRSEYSYLSAVTCFNYPDNPNWTGAGKTTGSGCATKPLEEYYTNYYPLSTYAVALKIDDNTLMDTSLVMDNDGKYNLTTTPISVTFPGIPTLYQDGTYLPPTGTHWHFMNQTLDQGYWIGQGNLQLTGVAMTQFFGWYYQHLAEGAPVSFANFNDFVTQYLGDGLLAWEGGLFYWNVRVQGYNQPTLHAVLTGPKDACHDIGLTTYLINGGCNNANERVLYYKYFKTDVFKQSSSGVPYTYQGTTSNSMECSENLKNYCTSA
jgi:hypothetical protein